mmetsp:Transcript_11088/g.23495  ORF Transcript_11088/g.23495 Transcript_11088/m.23495 type:complete len:310 (+) Transcript_11088:233-1162(+)
MHRIRFVSVRFSVSLRCARLCLFRLVLDTIDAGTDRILVTEVSSLEGREGSLLGDRLEVVVELVDEGGSGGDVQVADLALVDPVEVLHQGAEGVSVGGDQDRLSRLQLGGNVGIPKGDDPVEGGGEGLGEFLRPLGVGVPLVVGRVVLAARVDGRWGDVVAAAPDQDLVLPVLVDGLLLVESLEAPVVALVHLPRLGDGDPHAVRLLEDVPEGADGALLQRGKGDVGLDPGLVDELSALGGLDVAGVAEGAVVPAGELVGEVPGRFSVSHQDEGVLVGLLEGGKAATEGGLRRQEGTRFRNGKHGGVTN